MSNDKKPSPPVLSFDKRLQRLEAQLPQLAGGMNQALGGIQNNLTQTSLVLDAVVAILGEQVVGEKLAELELERAKQEAARRQKLIEAALETGKAGRGGLQVTERVTENSILVGVETDANGNVKPPGRVEFRYAQVIPDYKKKLLGARVGDKITTPDNGQVEITAIYDPIEADPEVLKKDAEEAEKAKKAQQETPAEPPALAPPEPPTEPAPNPSPSQE